MSSFYGNAGYYLSEDGGGSSGTSDYNSLTNKPIKNLVGVTSQPIVFSSLSYGNYVLTGPYKYSNLDNSVKEESGQRCLQIYQDEQTLQKVAKFETIEGGKYYINLITFEEDDNYTIEKINPARDFLTTTQAELNTVAVQDGQLIFVQDSREIFLDNNGERQQYGNFIFIPNEEHRINIPMPVEGFYFVNDTNILWRYFKGAWTQITYKPAQQVEFMSYSEFPRVGDETKLYVSDRDIYRWKDGSYQRIGSSYWSELL